MKLTDMNNETAILVSQELAAKCDAATALAQEIVDMVSHEYTVDQVLTAFGVLVGQQAPSIDLLQKCFITMEHAAVASFAHKHGTRVQEN